MADVQFDMSQINRNVEILLQTSLPQRAKAVQEEYKIITSAAIRLIEQNNLLSQKLQQVETDLKLAIKSWHSIKSVGLNNAQAAFAYNDYREARKRARLALSNNVNQLLEFYNTAFEFQKYLNAVLGQKVKTAYVWVGSSKVPETYVIDDTTQFLKPDFNRYGNIVVRYRNNVQDLRTHAQKLEQLLQDSTDFNFTSLQNTYVKASARFKQHRLTKGGGSFVLWLSPFGDQKWHGVKVSSLGSINEAYAYFILQEHFVHSDTPEDDMQQFMNQVLNVSNLPGALKGDVTVQNIEYAIKSKGATTLSIKQLVTLAQELLAKKLNNLQAIQNYLKEKQGSIKSTKLDINMKEALQNIADENMDTAIRSVLG